MGGLFRTLDAMVDRSSHLEEIRKSELKFGDWLLVTTANDATYSIRVLDDGNVCVTGGWFDRHELSPFKTRINGCTWGGSAIKTDIVAACGLCLEFANRVVTSYIRKIIVFRMGKNFLN